MKKKGRNNVTVDDLVHVIMPKGRGKISFFYFFIIYLATIYTYLFFVQILLEFCIHKHRVLFDI